MERAWGRIISVIMAVGKRPELIVKHGLISCIIPVYNGERYIGEAIESILAQTYRPVEVIVVDDGSTDGTPELVDSYGVRYVQQANAGAAAARNLGVEIAQGELIAFLDADDVWHPEKLARQAERFTARPELDLCVTHIQNFWDSELQEEAERFRDHRLAQAVPGYVTQTLLARRKLFDRVGRFNTSLQLSDATDWFLRVTEHGGIMELLPDVLVSRRLHAANPTRRHAAVSTSEYLQLVKASLDRRRWDGKKPRPYTLPVADLGR